jgi:hypothetical protein
MFPLAEHIVFVVGVVLNVLGRWLVQLQTQAQTPEQLIEAAQLYVDTKTGEISWA